MKKTLLAWLLASGLAGTIGAASAFPVGPSDVPESFLLSIAVATFKGTIPTEANPITGTARLAKMRREGRLPDTFVRGRCEYSLAGDPGAAYYVKTCR
jgi:hypothetical protein